MTQTNFQRVIEFHRAFGHPVAGRPVNLPEELQELRFALVEEELEEWRDAVRERDVIEQADALLDLLYVTYGALAVLGVDADAGFAEVHRANMSKLGADGRPILRPDGKILKGPDYKEPDLGPIVRDSRLG